VSEKPRVFFNGDTVPPGMCVLDGWGTVRYLDETDTCRCDDSADGCGCSFPVENGGFGPLVEMFLPDYGALVVDEAAHRDNQSGDAR
jgi:hypothetical protein